MTDKELFEKMLKDLSEVMETIRHDLHSEEEGVQADE